MLQNEEYFDKVHGGWIGKCIGGAAGAPVEGIKKLIDVENFTDIMRPDLPNDDLDLQILWLEVLQKKGTDFTSEDLADAWDAQVWYPFNEYGNFLRNYESGIMPPTSGSYNNRVFSSSEGAPIRSEIWGMICPGDPKRAAAFAEKDAVLDHSEDGVWIEQFYSAIESQAFFESDIRKLISLSIDFLPVNSPSRSCAEYVLDIFEETNDWITAREKLIRKYGHFDFTNAVVNLGIVLIALLYAKTFEEGINISFRCGYDTDSTCATAGAILGIIEGASNIPDEMKALISEDLVIGIDVVREDKSLAAFSNDVCDIGRLVSKKQKENQIIKDIDITVKYADQPCFDADNSCKIEITLQNSSAKKISDRLQILGLSEKNHAQFNNLEITLLPYSSTVLPNRLFSDDKEFIPKVNKFTILFGKETKNFGVSGPDIWHCAGPFADVLDKKSEEDIQFEDENGLHLPTLECGLNNYSDLQKEYLNEDNVSESILNHDSLMKICAQEDTLPLQEAYSFYGQGCIYFTQTIFVEQDIELWYVIGNNDSFKLWINNELVKEKEETRLWTPYNNYGLLKLKQGENSISIKLLRTTDKFDFSFALRNYDGEFFHIKRWFLDYFVKK